MQDDIDKSDAATDGLDPEGAEDAEKPEDSEVKPEHEPPPEHPRFKEIYGKMKHYERELADREEKDRQRDEDLEALRKHNEAMMETLTGVEDKFSEVNKPDRIEDPEAYDNWLIEKAKREFKKEQSTVKKEPEPTPINPQVDPYEAAMRINHEDYDAIIQTVNQDMAVDPVLRRDIMNKPPEKRYKDAYEYGKKRMEKVNTDRQANLDRGYVEGDTRPVDTTGKRVLSPDEKRVAKLLGVSEEKYLNQVKAIEGE